MLGGWTDGNSGFEPSSISSALTPEGSAYGITTNQQLSPTKLGLIRQNYAISSEIKKRYDVLGLPRLSTPIGGRVG